MYVSNVEVVQKGCSICSKFKLKYQNLGIFAVNFEKVSHKV